MKHSIFVFHQENHSSAANPFAPSPDAVSNSTPPLLPVAGTQHVSLALDPSVTPSTPAESASTQWHLSFEVPTAFSASTEHAIETGVLLKKHKIEIVQSLAMLIVVHTKNPNSEQYNKLCEKLILRHPTLKDDLGSSGYVSH